MFCLIYSEKHAVYIPPNEDELTAEEDFSEDMDRIKENENADITGTFKIQTNKKNLYDNSHEETLAVITQKILEQNPIDLNPAWTLGQLLHRNLLKSKEEDMIEVLRNQLEGLSHLDNMLFFFFEDAILDLKTQYSEKYFIDNNQHVFYLSREEFFTRLSDCEYEVCAFIVPEDALCLPGMEDSYFFLFCSSKYLSWKT